MRKFAPLILLLAFAPPLTPRLAQVRAQTAHADRHSQPPAPKKADAPFITLPAAVKADVGDWCVVKATTNCKALLWDVAPGLTQLPSEVVREGPWVVVYAKAAGTYNVSVVGTLNDTLTSASCVVQVGPPTPPTPPVPPTPDPFSGKASADPFRSVPESAAGNLHVLILLKSDDITKLPAAQVAALRATAVRQYMSSHGDWRIWDVSTDPASDAPVFGKALARGKNQPLPWLAISNGSQWYVGPLPKDTDALLTLLTKYGGSK